MKFAVALIPLFAHVRSVQAQNETLAFDGCDVDEYYDIIVDDTDEAQWFDLLASTHRNVLPSIGDKGDLNVLHALVDLDSGYDEDVVDPMVRLYMRGIDFIASQQNTPEGWKRGDLWPKSRGASLASPAGTDVHSKRPTDWEVNSAIENLFWGTCGTVEDAMYCAQPAIAEQTAPTTAQDGKIKTPPEDMRGDVARSVFYTALRYGEDLGLTLTDCPPFSATEYGYKSELLKWHAADPVDDRERIRNDKVCRDWQGNRNPFIDRPDLVRTLFGEPDSILGGTNAYAACTEPTNSPTATPNACSGMEAGDVQVLIFNSGTEPLDQIVFFPVSAVPEEVGSLFVTDRAWDGSDFVTDEGTIEYFLPEGGIPAGELFGYGVTFPAQTGNWSSNEDSLFDLSSVAGDNIFVYCINADDKPVFLNAITYEDGGFVAPSQDTYDYSTTSLPEMFGWGTLALPRAPSYLYDGPKDGTKTELLAAFADPGNYKGSFIPYTINTSSSLTLKTLFAMSVAAISWMLS